MAERHITMMGVGGAGCRLAGWLTGRARPGDPLRTVAVDTDTCALAEADVHARVQIGEDLTAGFGAGGDEERGRLAAEADLPRIVAELDGCGILILLTGLGGGVGSGAAPVVAGAARSAGVMTVAFAVQPFVFEGPQKRAAAQRALAALREMCDVVIAVPNDDLFEHVEGAALPELFDQADAVLGGGAYALWQLLARPGYIRLDPPALSRIAADTDGACALGYAEASGDDRARRAARALLEGPMLDKGRLIEKARLAMVLIVGGPDLRLKEVGEIMDLLTPKVRAECRLVMGTSMDDAWAGRVTVCVIAGEKRAVAPMPATEIVGAGTPAEAPPAPEDAEASPAAAAPPRRGHGKDRQSQLPLEQMSGRGRFKDVEPTLQNGTDLDIPTFVRRGIRIEK
jgi:cell division protein FtsZ